jgi:hypothetical protein
LRYLYNTSASRGIFFCLIFIYDYRYINKRTWLIRWTRGCTSDHIRCSAFSDASFCGRYVAEILCQAIEIRVNAEYNVFLRVFMAVIGHGERSSNREIDARDVLRIYCRTYWYGVIDNTSRCLYALLATISRIWLQELSEKNTASVGCPSKVELISSGHENVVH